MYVPNRIRIPHSAPQKTRSWIGGSDSGTIVSMDTLQISLILLGQTIVYFTMFYCSMNWLYYKRLQEKNKDKEDKK